MRDELSIKNTEPQERWCFAAINIAKKVSKSGLVYSGDDEVTSKSITSGGNYFAKIAKVGPAADFVKEGDYVFSRVGTLGRCAIVTKSEEGWLISGQMLRLRLKDVRLNLSFIGYVSGVDNHVQSAAGELTLNTYARFRFEKRGTTGRWFKSTSKTNPFVELASGTYQQDDAIGQLDFILDVKGIDATFIGPYDLSGSLGISGDFEIDEYKNALSFYIAKSNEHSVPRYPCR